MTNSPRLEEPLHEAVAQGRKSLLANGFYGAPLDLKQAPLDIVTAAKDTMKDSSYRATVPVASINGHHAQAGQHASSTSTASTEQAVATASSTSHNLPERLSPSSSSPESRELSSGATGPLLPRKPVPQEEPPAIDKAGPPKKPSATSSNPTAHQQRPHPRSHSSSAPRPAYGQSRRLSQSAFLMPATTFYIPSPFTDIGNPNQGPHQQQFWSAGGMHQQAGVDALVGQGAGNNAIHAGYFGHEEGYGQPYLGMAGGMNMYPPPYNNSLPVSTLAQPVSYAQQQYQQHYGQGQYIYPGPVVPMTLPYMSQQYDANNSPLHAGPMGPQAASSTGSPPGALYYPPVFLGPADYASTYYPQGQHYGTDGTVYFSPPYAPEYYGPSFGNGYTGAPSNALPRLQKGGRGHRQPRNQQHHGASFQGHSAVLPDSQKRAVAGVSGADADSNGWSFFPGHRRQRSLPGPDTQQRPRGHRRQASSPAEVQGFRSPWKASPDSFPHSKARGHTRHFSLPGGVEFASRLQGLKGGDGRRHRRARSEEAKAAAPEEPRAAGILEDFKSNRSQQYALEDIHGHVFDFCRDQFGSRFIQQKLETATPTEVEAIFDEVCASTDTALKLMCDVFGNYVVQKFLEHGTPAQRSRLAGAMRGSVKSLSTQMYGCRVIQKAIEVLSLEEKVAIVDELKGQIIECVADQNGNHVIQKCIEAIKPTKNIQSVLEELAGMRPSSASAARRTMLLPSKIALKAGFVTMSRHPYGCRVVQRILEHCDIEPYTQALLEEVHKHALDLARDTYGNYVIQHSLQHGDNAQRSDVIHRLQGHIVGLSQHKFASNVIEKCLQHGNRQQCTAMVEEMLGIRSGLAGPAREELLHQMMRDQYGNYVVQKTLEVLGKLPRKHQLKFIAVLLHMNDKQAVELRSLLKFTAEGPGVVCTEAQREELLKRVHNHLIALKKLTYGKHIVGRVEKLLINAATPASKKDEAGAQSSTEPSDDELGAAQVDA